MSDYDDEMTGNDELSGNLVALREAANEIVAAVEDALAVGANTQNLGDIISALELIDSLSAYFDAQYENAWAPDTEGDSESAYEQELAADIAEDMARDYDRDQRLADILGVDVNTVIAALPDDDIVPDELWQAALAQVNAEGL